MMKQRGIDPNNPGGEMNLIRLMILLLTLTVLAPEGVFAQRGEEGFPIEIVGVVKDAKLGTPGDRRGAWYFPYR